jgi:hypothetical protein
MLRPAAMLRPFVVSALITAGLCGVAHADVYRWVDDKGEAHYSDRWVPGSQLIKSNRPHPTSADSSSGSGQQDQGKAVNTTAQSASEKLAQKANADAVKQDVAKTREAQCKAAKQHYQEAIDARRIYKSPQPGDTDRQYMNDSETDAYRQTMRNEVTQSCGSPPPAASGGGSSPSSSYPTASRPQRDPEAPSERPE